MEAEKKLKPKDKPANFGNPLLVILTSFGIFLASQLAVLLVDSIYLLTHPASNGHISDSAPMVFFSVLSVEAVAVLFVFWVLKLRHLKLADIGLGRLPSWRDARYSVIGFLAFFGLSILATLILGLLLSQHDLERPQDIGFNDLGQSLERVLAFFSLVIIAPIGEETLMRGYLYSGLRSRWSFVAAGLMTSILFGAAHLFTGSDTNFLWAAAADTFILSLVLVYLRERTGALYAGMTVHGLNNLLAFLVLLHK